MRDGKPSWTALVVALWVIVLGQLDSPLLPPDIVPLQIALLEAVGLPIPYYFLLQLLRSRMVGPFLARCIHAIVSFACRDTLESIAVRKSFMEQQVRQFLDQNNTKANNNNITKKQVLILGAGYDTLTLRLCKHYPNVKFWELDHPATGSFKNRHIWNHSDKNNNTSNTSKDSMKLIGEKPKNLFFASVDLSKKGALVDTLSRHKENYSTTSPSIVVMEGFLMYFDTDQVRNLLDDLSRVIGPGSVAAFDMVATTYDTPNNQQQPKIGWIASFAGVLIKLMGEPWLLGIDTTILTEFLAESNCPWKQCCDVQTMGPECMVAIQLKDHPSNIK